MGKKWKRIDPAEIKAGDRVKAVGQGLVVTGEVDDDTTNVVIVGDLTLGANAFAWYVRKPAKPLTRPAEPPVGTFFRVDRTGVRYHRADLDYLWYCRLDGDARGWARYDWDEITEPGDTITRLELTEVGDKRDADA